MGSERADLGTELQIHRGDARPAWLQRKSAHDPLGAIDHPLALAQPFEDTDIGVRRLRVSAAECPQDTLDLVGLLDRSAARSRERRNLGAAGALLQLCPT